jgi:CheY-like chemotaxis protein
MARAERPTILVADETRENPTAAVRLLQDEYRINVARNGMWALEIAAAVPHPS